MKKELIVELLGLALGDNKSEKSLEVPFKIGENYFIRTATYHCTGKIKEIIGHFLVLEKAAWIAESARFADTIKRGELKEVEPVEVEMYVNLDGIIDAFEWKHPLPREQK